MAQQRPCGSSVSRLLLLAALLFGILTMHTLGHPSGGHGGHGPRLTAAQPTAEHHAVAAGSTHVTADLATADGMDPMAVCLAVLAGWTLLLLVVGPLLRRSGDAAAEVRARLLRAVRALPPPGGGRTLLSRLAVLRQ
ncbi:hypothetical protein [Kitasatospora sp. NPDC017646]|uniref:hypothetical protein n=1 Tax=Kitasatospora sp. NPDC017646 TaxID=3364024 RepID=UPI00379E6C23